MQAVRSETANKVYIQYHGCQMNEYDAKQVLGMLIATYQFTQTTSLEEATLAILITCSVRDKAAEKMFSELGRWHALRERHPRLVIAVGGCVASQEGEAIRRRAPYVSLIFGPQTIHRLGTMLAEYYATKRPVIDIRFPEIEKFDHLPAPQASGPLASVTIMEGCSKYCSFCVVPYTRGEEISRPLDDVLAEIAQLAEQNVREVTLLGQNVNDYRGLTFDGQLADLATLIEYIAAMDHIVRIRFTTSHPVAFGQRLMQAYADIPKLANHLHLPVQSGSDRILGLMKRGYTALEFKAKIRRLRAIRPMISISSDFIVGFPGETEEDFQATLQLVQSMCIDQSYSFIYSKRPGTPAATLPDPTSLTEKKERLHRLQQQLTINAQHISQAMLGTEQIVIIAEQRKQQLAGRTENNRIIHFQGSVDLIGQVGRVKVTEVLRNTLRGELLDVILEQTEKEH